MHDQPLRCRDGGHASTFTTRKQERFASRGFERAPSRCVDCGSARKAGPSESTGEERRDHQLFSATGSGCDQEARVHVRPRGDNPVYCATSFQHGGGALLHTGRQAGRVQ